MKYSTSSILAAALYATSAFAQYGSPTTGDTSSGGNSGSPVEAAPVTASSAVPGGATTQANRGVVNCRNNICYSMAVPQTTASRGSGDIYFQIFAPDTFSWVGLGTGSGMADSNMFLIYQNGQGNVTLSGRQAGGYTMPTVPTTGGPVLELLAGSGVANGWMVANFRCLNCESWKTSTLDFTGTGQSMVGAWQTGDSLDSADVNARIGKHTGNIRSFSFDVTQAAVSTTGSPFIGDNAIPAELMQNNGGGASGNGNTPDNAGPGASAMLSQALGVAVILAGVPLLFL